MCNACNVEHDREMRCTPLDEDEIRMLKNLKAMDPKKLAARVPAWAKPKRLVSAPRFVPGAAPVYPRQSQPNRALPILRAFPPEETASVAAYVKAFERANRLRSTV